MHWVVKLSLSELICKCWLLIAEWLWYRRGTEKWWWFQVYHSFNCVYIRLYQFISLLSLTHLGITDTIGMANPASVTFLIIYLFISFTYNYGRQKRPSPWVCKPHVLVFPRCHMIILFQSFCTAFSYNFFPLSFKKNISFLE